MIGLLKNICSKAPLSERVDYLQQLMKLYESVSMKEDASKLLPDILALEPKNHKLRIKYIKERLDDSNKD